MQINEKDLENLLLNNKDKYCWSKNYTELLINFSSILTSILCLYYVENMDTWLKTTLLILLAITVIALVSFILKLRYTDKTLFNEICAISSEKHAFSNFVIVKPDNKILMKYDPSWKCYLLPYVKAITTLNGTLGDKEELNRTINFIQDSLKVTLDNVKLAYRTDIKKYLVSDKINKIYDTRFFLWKIKDADISRIVLRNDYKWMSIEELETDEQTIKKNKETIEVVKNYVLNSI